MTTFVSRITAAAAAGVALAAGVGGAHAQAPAPAPTQAAGAPAPAPNTLGPQELVEDSAKRFVKAFYHSLLHNYGNALLNFTAGNFTVLPYRGDPNETQASVRTEIKKSDGSKVPVLFTLHKTPQGWKAWDVVIDGISYVKSFKTDFASEVQQKGLDELIARLERGDIKPAGGVPGTSP
jgi:hypothetical protein